MHPKSPIQEKPNALVAAAAKNNPFWRRLLGGAQQRKREY